MVNWPGIRAVVWAGFTVAASLAAVSPPVAADPAPGSLRVDHVGSLIRLSWELGSGPFAIYRSPHVDDVRRPAWIEALVQTSTSYDDPIPSHDPDLIFYVVAYPLLCSTEADCDDYDACDGIEQCVGIGECEGGTPVVCRDNDRCTVEACNPQTGACDVTPLDCDDGIPCTVDSCHPVSGCDHDVDPLAGVGSPAELAGVALGAFPFFEYTGAFNEGTEVQIAVDPSRRPDLVGATCDAYVVEAREAAEWCAGFDLEDVRGAPDAVTVVAGGIESNAFSLAGSAQLDGDGGTATGHGYDVVLDCNRNGLLDGDEPVDGLSDRSGLYVVRDLTRPGPLPVATFDDIGPDPPLCSGGGLDDLRVFYPASLDDPGFVGQYPLVVISHGNGHCYDWYDFLGNHLASYGYIVMTHDNDTGPGIETASETTLLFTDKILREQETLGGGVLDGHIDAHRIAWIGHSRGGEGVVRAYDRLVDEAYPSQFFSASDIVLISSIAPTDFLGPDLSDPHDVAYHLLYGSADGDVCGCPNNPIAQSFSLLERASGARQSTYVHGADHNDFNCCGFNDFVGPLATQIGRAEAQQVQKAHTLALLKLYLDGDRAPWDYFHRQYEALRPLGVDPGTTVVNESRDHPGLRNLVIDDFQSEFDDGISSSGSTVTATVSNLVEDRLRELNTSFDWTGSEPMNGMTRGRSQDTGRGLVFDDDGSGDAYVEFEVAPGTNDFTDDAFLSFRAAQGTRHPLTVAELGDVDFTVTLTDGIGNTSSIRIGAYGGGIEEPYQRTGYGTGTGWQNEFETIRIRLTDFVRNGASLDLGDIRSIRFEFGPSFGSAGSRIALDDIELVRE